MNYSQTQLSKMICLTEEKKKKHLNEILKNCTMSSIHSQKKEGREGRKEGRKGDRKAGKGGQKDKPD